MPTYSFLSDTYRMNRNLDILAWVFQTILILLFVQSISVKVMGSPESVYVFQNIGMDPAGRYISSLFEAVAIVGIVISRFFKEGAVLSFLIFAVGIYFHLTVPELGINVWADHGLRFYLAVTGLVLSLAVFFIRTHLAKVLYHKGTLD